MKRTRLCKDAKTVLRILDRKTCSRPFDMNQREFNLAALELQDHGLAECHQESNGDVVVARITDRGRLYLARNPMLRNPVCWTAVSAIAAIAGTIIAIIALLIACHVV